MITLTHRTYETEYSGVQFQRKYLTRSGLSHRGTHTVSTSMGTSVRGSTTSMEEGEERKNKPPLVPRCSRLPSTHHRLSPNPTSRALNTGASICAGTFRCLIHTSVMLVLKALFISFSPGRLNVAKLRR